MTIKTVNLNKKLLNYAGMGKKSSRKKTSKKGTIPSGLAEMINRENRVGIRKIKNGYITSKETYNKSTGYQTEEYYTKTNPLK